MENKMPFLGIINCRNLWKIDYHLHHHSPYLSQYDCNMQKALHIIENQSINPSLVFSRKVYNGGIIVEFRNNPCEHWRKMEYDKSV
jgi:hypothetical protein